jgi:uncharacterized membrane protein
MALSNENRGFLYGAAAGFLAGLLLNKIILCVAIGAVAGFVFSRMKKINGKMKIKKK